MKMNSIHNRRFQAKRYYIGALITVSYILKTTTLGLPSLDPAQRDQVSVEGDSYTVIRDHKQPYKWYYTPGRIRFLENASGVPQVSVVTYVDGNKRHAIIQASVTCAAPKHHVDAMRETAARWYTVQPDGPEKVQAPQPNQIQIAPVGPFKVAGVRLLEVVKTNSGLTVTPLTDPTDAGKPVAVETTPDKPLTVAEPAQTKSKTVGGTTVEVKPTSNQITGTSLVFPGGQDLTQATVIQVEVSGIGVDIYENLLKGKTGGLALYLEGTYDAISIPVNITVDLNVSAMHEYFREDVGRVSGWRFLCFGNRSSSVSTYIRSNSTLKKAFVFNGTKTEDISDAQYEAISSQLVKWATEQIFTVSTQPNPPGSPQKLELPDTTVDLGKFGPLFGLGPLGGMGLSVGFSRSSENVKFDLKQNYTAEAHAAWNQRFVKSTPIAISGALSLGGYPSEKTEGLIRNIQPTPLPRLSVRMPIFTDNRLVQAMTAAKVSLTVGGHGRVWGYTTGERNYWKYDGNDDELGISDADRLILHPNTLMVTFNAGTDTSGAVAKLTLNRLNTHANAINAEVGVPNPIEMAANADGIINFAGNRFPFKSLTVDPTSLEFGDKGIQNLLVTFGITGGGLAERRELDTNPIVFPPFNKVDKNTQSLLYAGLIQGVAAKIKYTDALSGGALNATWKASGLATSNLETTGGYLSLTPQDFEIQNYTIDLEWLFTDVPKIRGVEVSVMGTGDQSFAVMVNRQDPVKVKDPHVINFVTAKPLKSVKLNLFFDDGTEREVDVPESKVAGLIKSRSLFLTGSVVK